MCISSLCALLFFVYPILALLFRPFRYFVTLTVPLVVCCRYLNKDKVTVNDFRIWNLQAIRASTYEKNLMSPYLPKRHMRVYH
jgi:hypothetical protein